MTAVNLGWKTKLRSAKEPVWMAGMTVSKPAKLTCEVRLGETMAVRFVRVKLIE